MSSSGPITDMPMSTALEVPGLRIRENLGVCYGLVVRSMGAIGGISASFKALRRGEISEYTQLLEDSRRHAIDRMVDNARLLGADAIIAVRFDSSEIGQQFTEIVAYGTAVKADRIDTEASMLLGDPDRELLYEMLKRHAAEGRLDVAELERRVAVVAQAQTREEAAAAMAGLPPLASPAPVERRPRWGRGHGEAERPEPDWQPTDERFRDPRTRAVLRVWVDGAGARHYVAE